MELQRKPEINRGSSNLDPVLLWSDLHGLTELKTPVPCLLKNRSLEYMTPTGLAGHLFYGFDSSLCPPTIFPKQVSFECGLP